MTMREDVYAALHSDTHTLETLVTEVECDEDDAEFTVTELEQVLGVWILTAVTDDGEELLRVGNPQKTLREFLEYKFL